MLYSTLVDSYKKLESTTKRLEMTDILVELMKKTTPADLEKVIYMTQGKIHPDWTGEPELGVAERTAVEAVARVSGINKKDVESLLAETGDIGHAAEKAMSGKRLKSLGVKRLSVADVYEAFDKIAKESGKGSNERKIDRLTSLITDASPLEARYILRTVTGALRLGIGDMTILDALAIAFTDSAENRDILERAYNLTSDLGFVARRLAESGLKEIENVKAVVGKPIRMMLAQRLSTPDEIIDKLGGKCSAEFKLDGERFQIHKKGKDVQIFSRRLENITHMYPDAVDLSLKHLKATDAIVEGEAVATDPDTNEMRPFQTLMQRRRKYGINEMMEKFPVTVFLFECLYVDGEDLTLAPYSIRRQRLKGIVAETERFKIVRALETSKTLELEKFFEEAITEGCEGLVVKSTGEDSIYRAGARSWLWVKLKRSYQSKMVEPIDLVVVGAFHGRGKRAGSYGALLMAAFDPEEDVFKTVCKVGSGFTDEDLDNLPKMLEPYKRQEKHPRVNALLEADIWFSPSIVIEVLGDEITLSPVHTAAFNVIRENSGLAVRFPRFTGKWRVDKSPEDATQVTEIIDMYKAQLKTISKEDSDGS